MMTIQDIYSKSAGLNAPAGGSLAGLVMSGYIPASGSAAGASGATTTSNTGTLTGATPNGWTPASGGVPGVPSPQTSQAAATAGNAANMGALKGVASDINAFNLNEVLKQYQSGIPGYDAMAAKSASNITDALNGKLPADVINLIAQNAAERGTAGGFAGGPNANAAYLRALGLTSLGQQQYGEQALTGAVARMPKTGLYNLAGDMVTPEQQQEAQWMANLMAASPIPQAAYNQALQYGMMGQNYGFNSARQTVPGMSGGTSAAAAIAQKYAPAVVPSSENDPYAPDSSSSTNKPTPSYVPSGAGYYPNPDSGGGILFDPNSSLGDKAAYMDYANGGDAPWDLIDQYMY